MFRFSPSCMFSCVGPSFIIPRGSISLPITFGMSENYCTESVLFDVTKANLPFNTIMGRPALHQLMAITHYGYLVLKMPLPNDIIKICGDCTAGVFTLEKLQALTVTHEVVVGQGCQTRHHRAHASASHPLHPVCSPRTARMFS
jgi:hypothetical protein